MDLQLIETVPQSEFWRNPPHETLREGAVLLSRAESQGEAMLDIYRVEFEGRALGLREISALSGGFAPYLWRHVPIAAAQVDGHRLSPSSAFSHELQALHFVSTEGEIYSLPLTEDQDHFFHLNYNGALLGAQLFSQVVETGARQWQSAVENFLAEAGPTLPQLEIWRESEAADAPCTPLLGSAGLPERARLEEIYDAFQVPVRDRAPLLYDPLYTAQIGAMAYYHRADADEEATCGASLGAHIAVGDDYGARRPADRQAILAHEFGHHRYYQEVPLTFGQHYLDSVSWRLQELLAPEDARAQSLRLFLTEGLHLLSHQRQPVESEIYADLIALEWLRRRDGSVCAEDPMREELVAHLVEHLNILQEHWPPSVAAFALSELIYLFGSDPLISPETRELACALLGSALTPELVDRVRRLRELTGSSLPETAAGLTPYSCF